MSGEPTVGNHIVTAMSTIIEIARQMKKKDEAYRDSGETSSEKYYKTLNEKMKKLIQLQYENENHAKARNDISEEVQEIIRGNDDDVENQSLSDDYVTQSFNKKVQAMKKKKLKIDKHDMMKKLKLILAPDEERDEELEEIETEVTTIPKCPILQIEVQNPVKSKLCHHIYDKRGIEQYLKQKGGKVRCPAIGCGHELTQKDLVEDLLTREIIHRLKNPNN